jgi:hypothetical protein
MRRAESSKKEMTLFPMLTFGFSFGLFSTDRYQKSLSPQGINRSNSQWGTVQPGWSVRRMSRYCSNRFALLATAPGNGWSAADMLTTEVLQY